MLQAIHDRATGVIAWIIVVLISIPFALWGIGQYFEGGADLNVAVVNDQEISQRDFERVYRDQRQRLIERLGAGLANSLDEQTLKETLLDRFVADELLTQLSLDGSMGSSDAQIFSYISGDPSFHVDGQYDGERYKTILRLNGQTPAMYEQNLRRSLVLSQISDGLMGTAMSLNGEADRWRVLGDQSRQVELVTFPLSNYKPSVEIGDDQISAYYETNQDQFRASEQVRVAYLELSAKALTSEIQVTEEDLLAWYDDHQDQYLTPESRDASHILVEITPGKEGAEDDARAEIESIIEKLAGGESFEELAKTHSDDPGSATEGGSLGTVERGMMVPEFENALFALAPGQTSEPVKTEFGWHLIRLDAVNEPKGKLFEQVRAEVETQARQHKAEDRFFTLSETLADRSYEIPDSLEPAAEALGLTIAETGLFSREGGTGIAARSAVIETAFSDDVLNQGNNSAPVELGDNHVAVIRVTERVPERALALDEVRERIRDLLIEEAAREQSQQAAMTVAEGLRTASVDAGAVAADHGGTFARVDEFKRTTADQDPALRTAVFSMKKPVDGVPTTEVVTLPNGDAVAVRLLAVNESVSAGSTDENEAIRKQAAAIIGQRDYQAFIDHLKASASVVVNKDNL